MILLLVSMLVVTSWISAGAISLLVFRHRSGFTRAVRKKLDILTFSANWSRSKELIFQEELMLIALGPLNLFRMCWKKSQSLQDLSSAFSPNSKVRIRADSSGRMKVETDGTLSMVLEPSDIRGVEVG